MGLEKISRFVSFASYANTLMKKLWFMNTKMKI